MAELDAALHVLETFDSKMQRGEQKDAYAIENIVHYVLRRAKDESKDGHENGGGGPGLSGCRTL